MRYLKFALIAAGGLIVLLAVLVALVAATFNPNDYKPQLARWMKDATQRALTLEGDIRLALWPRAGLELGPLALSERGSEREFAAVGRVHLALALLPLLRDELVAEKIAVTGLRVNLVRHPDGSFNVDDLLVRSRGGAGFRFDIGAVTLEDAAVAYRDEARDAHYTVSRLHLRTGRLAEGVITPIELSFSAHAPGLERAVEARLAGRLGFDLAARSWTLQNVALEARGEAGSGTQVTVRASGDVTARLASSEVAWSGLSALLAGTAGGDRFDATLRASRFAFRAGNVAARDVTLDATLLRPRGTISAGVSLPRLAGTARALESGAMTLKIDSRQSGERVAISVASPLTLNVETREARLRGLAASFTFTGPALPRSGVNGELKGDARLDAGRQELGAQLAGKVMESRVRARIGVRGFAQPAIDFDADIDRLDLDRWLPPQAAGRRESQRALDWGTLKNLRASGTLRIGVLKAADVTSSNVKLVVGAPPRAAHPSPGALRSARNAVARADPRRRALPP
ncbi:MAG: AsmA family protein [Betaproteobacteria bacterium]|nr:AsmA family protein [Betaproteobacteria bacterium]